MIKKMEKKLERKKKMNYPEIQLLKNGKLKLSENLTLYPLMKNWDNEVKPYLTSKEVIEALKYGFSDHFQNEEEIDEYPWDNPRLDSFGAIGFSEMHEIMGEELFKEYIGEEYKDYYLQLEKRYDEEIEEYKDFVKDGSYFAYRALSRCHHLSPFLYEIGRKIRPDLEWYIVKTEAHSNAIGIKDGKAELLIDLLWGEIYNDCEVILKQMLCLTKTIIMNYLRKEKKLNEEELEKFEKAIDELSKNIIA